MGLKVYEHVDRKGKTHTFSKSTSYVGKSWNDKISSLEVTKENEIWYAHTDSKFKGKTWGPFTYEGTYNASPWFKNDAISSVSLYVKPDDVGLGEFTTAITAQLESEGHDEIVTPSEISTGQAGNQAEYDEGLPGQWDDKLFEDAQKIADTVEKTEDAIKDAIKDKVMDIAEIPEEISKLFWQTPQGKALKTGLIVAGVISVVVIVVVIILLILMYKNRDQIRQEQLIGAQHTAELMRVQTQAQLEPVKQVAGIAEANPQTTQIVARETGRAVSASATGGVSEVGGATGGLLT